MVVGLFIPSVYEQWNDDSTKIENAYLQFSNGKTVELYRDVNMYSSNSISDSTYLSSEWLENGRNEVSFIATLSDAAG